MRSFRRLILLELDSTSPLQLYNCMQLDTNSNYYYYQFASQIVIVNEEKLFEEIDIKNICIIQTPITSYRMIVFRVDSFRKCVSIFTAI